jgi:hypothetical protein
MAKRIPTQLGDVLILRTDRSFTICAVGPVSRDGQQDLHHQANVKHFRDRAAAVAEAKALVAPGGHIFFLNIDSGDWAEVLNLARAI